MVTFPVNLQASGFEVFTGVHFDGINMPVNGKNEIVLCRAFGCPIIYTENEFG
jgi:hypothetical protein